MFRTSLARISRISSKRFVQTASKEATEVSAATADPYRVPSLNDEEIQVIPRGVFSQAPNRETTWSPSQKPREEVYKNNVRFVGKDISKQPFSEAAIELTAEQPIHYVASNIAVCNGTDRFQGHPKVYINMDRDAVAHCGYCGAKYAREDLKGKL
ncbi:DEKNAAC101228 [Brettanomyces naardenensis]|uniref:DEKNAAC101228 n=1 Tax=Brettanomyces naardenensis TaxID=13370 RepID=A0A448YH76_BRENA|nr:DEKNAAC101228 [Brettanomyces naardenensis]